MKKVIIILIVLLVILLGALLAIIGINSNPKDITHEELAEQEARYKNAMNNPGLSIEGIVPSQVKVPNMFFTIEDCAKKYIQAIANNIKPEIYNLLDYKYINDKKITIENVEQYVKKYIPNQLNKTIEMYEVVGGSYNTYYLKHKLGTQTVYFTINTDSNNNSFSVMPIEEAMYNQKIKEPAIAFGNQEDTVEKNDNNTISYKYYEEEDIADKYLQDYLNNALLYPEEAYATLDKEYKEKKFGSIEAYKKYVEKNKEKLQSMCKSQRKQVTDFKNYKEYEEYFRSVYEIGLEKYQVNQKDGNMQYILIDSYGNYYIFNTDGVMNYTVLLDTYTIDQPEFIEKYTQMSENQKVQANIQKVFDAINLGDYEYMYKKLDPTFKNTYFKTQTEFENYIKKNFFSSNSIGYRNYQKNEDVYLYNIQISNKQGAGTIQKKVVMQLKEGTDFVMSFNVE